ncbi:hypothetical protein, partial [Staphylococcus aureus]|uniref:hypothetical protein n=1 Tax=Staphylococcus aureus TaxID=1280 RepID=UPI0038B356E9
MNVSRTMQAPQKIPMAKPGRVVGPVVPYENGNVLKDAYDRRTLVRSSMMPPQAVPPAYCYRKPSGG